LLNAQPLGFYTPSQLVQDARRHGVEVRPIDVCHSQIEATLEERPGTPDVQAAVRLGLHLVQGLSRQTMARIVQARQTSPLRSAADLARRARLSQSELQLLAAADALASLSGHRRQQVWDASAWQAPPALLNEARIHEAAWALPQAPEGEDVVFDHAATGLSLRSHPLALLRPQLEGRNMLSSQTLRTLPHRRLARTCGLVTLRQRPGTAKGVIFVSLEDETGSTQVIVWPSVAEQFRAELLGSKLLAVFGVWQRDGEACNLIARRLANWSDMLGGLSVASRDFK